MLAVARHPRGFWRLWGCSVGFYGVWVAHAGRRMGLFAELAKKPASALELAKRSGLDGNAVGAWASAAVALGFVDRESKSGLLRISREMKEVLLDEKSPHYLGGQFSYIALRSLEYGGLDDLFRSGKTRDMARTFEAIEQATDWDHNAFLSAIRKKGKRKGSSLHAMLSGGCRLLDVGCGTGTLIEKLSNLYPRSSFVGVEPSEEAARKAMAVAAAAAAADVKIVHMAGEGMEFDSEFDICYLGESLYAAGDKKAVVANCYRALKKGGTVAIVEGLLPAAGDRNLDLESRLIMGMQLDFALQGHRFMTKKEVESLLRGAGFARVSFSDLGGSLFLVIARKR